MSHSERIMEAAKEPRLPRQVWELHDHDFNILHDPKDDSPCDVHEHEDGYPICKNIAHLEPISKEWSKPNA